MADKDLMMEYHKRSDHGRDGGIFGVDPVCNCAELFAEYNAKIIQRAHDTYCTMPECQPAILERTQRRND